MGAGRRLLVSCAILSGLAGCATGPPPRAIYVPVPAGYLQPCPLPPLPQTTADLSDAFATAYRCAVQGNNDKKKIGELPRD